MRKVFVALLVSIGLVGCGESQSARTPLTHALSAFRSGDHADFLEAKSEAEAALNTAIQPGSDLCLMTMMDVEKYGTVSVIEKLDKPELFASNEDKRLVYALKYAGKHLVIEPGSFLSQSPLVLAISDPNNAPSCAGEKDKQASAMEGAGPQAQDANEARMVMMHDWMRDLKSKYGSDFDQHMHDASASLESSGYSVTWPAEVDFIE